MAQNFYVDDLISGSTSVDECIPEINDASAIMNSACMNLTELAQRLQETQDIHVKHTGMTNFRSSMEFGHR